MMSRAGLFGGLLKNRKEILHVGDLLVVNQDVGILEVHSILSGSVTK